MHWILVFNKHGLDFSFNFEGGMLVKWVLFYFILILDILKKDYNVIVN
jgi:hypothetical protein